MDKDGWAIHQDQLHETIAALRGEVERLKQELYDPDYANRIVQLEAALSRYREAVEWACRNSPLPYQEAVNFAAELRRRAGEATSTEKD